MTRKLLAITVATVALLLLLTSAAAAEGYWTSYISGALTGFNSRNWTDNHNDSNSTLVTFDNCTETSDPYLSGENADVQLWRVISLWPDVKEGTHTLYCYNAWATGDYGEMTTAGTYHFTISKIDGSTSGHQIDVQYVEVDY